MNIEGSSWRTIWVESDGRSVGVIDQTRLPHDFRTLSLRSYQDVAHAIIKTYDGGFAVLLCFSVCAEL